MTRSAVDSWDGYNYQGQVTIFYALKLINDIHDVKPYFIEIEGVEDFAVINGENYQSLHQIKGKYSSSTLNGYIDAIIAILKEYDKTKADECFLHVAKEINNWDFDAYRKELNKYDLDVLNYDLDVLNSEMLELNKKLNEFKGDTLNAKKVSTLKTKLDKVEKKIQKLEKSIEKLKERIEKEPEEIDYLKSINNKDTFDRTKLFTYCVDEAIYSYCDSLDLDVLIKNEIKRYYENTHQHQKTGDMSIETIALNLTRLIEVHIRERHLDKSLRNGIDLQDIVILLDDDTLLHRDRLYYIYKLRHFYSEIRKEEYCEYCLIAKSQKNCNQDEMDKCSLLKVTEYLRELETEEIVKQIRLFNPHIDCKVEEDTWQEYVSKSSIIEPLYYVIAEVLKDSINNHGAKVYSCFDGEHYLPTTMEADGPFKAIKSEEYAVKIKNNQGVLNELFDSNYFITKNIRKDDILENFSDVEETEAKKITQYEQEKYSYIKTKVSLKPYNELVEEN